LPVLLAAGGLGHGWRHMAALECLLLHAAKLIVRTAPAAKNGQRDRSSTSHAANRGDWRARNLEAFTMPELSDKASQIRMESCARPCHARAWQRLHGTSLRVSAQQCTGTISRITEPEAALNFRRAFVAGI
jgi:hypothetical protein